MDTFTYKGVDYEIYECPKWAVDCSYGDEEQERYCNWQTGTHTKAEALSLVKEHIREEHSGVGGR